MTDHQVRYTGDHATVFLTGNAGAVEPGGLLTVPEDMLGRFTSRPDVEHAEECPCGWFVPPPAPDGADTEGKPAKSRKSA